MTDSHRHLDNIKVIPDLRQCLHSKLPTFIRDKMDYSKSYHPAKGEESNIDENFKKDIDLSEHILKRLKRMAM